MCEQEQKEEYRVHGCSGLPAEFVDDGYANTSQN